MNNEYQLFSSRLLFVFLACKLATFELNITWANPNINTRYVVRTGSLELRAQMVHDNCDIIVELELMYLRRKTERVFANSTSNVFYFSICQSYDSAIVINLNTKQISL